MNLPRVSIGIPVYNGEKFLKRALISIIYQSHKNIEIIISNNCSTDNSLEIIRNFKKIDNRIILHDQKEKLSMMDNFRFVLKKSNSNYFMWAACDDFRSRNFIQKNLEFLENNKDFVAAISPARFFKYKYNSKKIGDQTLDDQTAYKRIKKGLKLNANSRFYSLFRSDLLKTFNYIDNNYLGDDFPYIIHMLIKGKFKNIGEGSLILSKSGMSNRKNIFKKYQENYIDLILPFNKLLKNSLILSKSIKLKFLIFIKILKFNFDANILRFKWLILKMIR